MQLEMLIIEEEKIKRQNSRIESVIKLAEIKQQTRLKKILTIRLRQESSQANKIQISLTYL